MGVSAGGVGWWSYGVATPCFQLSWFIDSAPCLYPLLSHVDATCLYPSLVQLFYAEGGKSPVGLRCGLRFVCALVAVDFTRAEQIVTGFQSGVSAHCAGEALAYGTDEVTGEFAWFYQPVDWRLAASNVWQHGQSGRLGGATAGHH